MTKTIARGTTPAAPIKAREAFHNNGSSFRGEPRDDGYVVYSYSTIIARSTPEEGWTLTGHKYSATTSRHMSSLRQALNALGHAFTTSPDPLPQRY